MVWVPKAKRSVIAAAIALVVAGVSGAPAWAQFTCGRDMPSDRDRPDSGGMSIDSARQIVASQRSYLPIGAQLPTDTLTARTLLTSAKNDCARAVNEKKKRIDARMCLADATLLLRRLGDPNGDLQVAHCNYVAANTLIKTLDETKALALEGVARTYEETTNPVAAVPLREAIPVALRTDARKMDLARLYAKTNNAAKADTAYSDLNLLSKPDGYQYSQTEREALREWAMLRSGSVLQNPQGAVDVWKKLDTAEAHSEVGRYYFYSNRVEDENKAKLAFENVIRLKNDEGASARVAEASYLLGIMAARKARTALAWNDVNKFARDAGSSDPRHKRLACLSLIASGEKAALSSMAEPDSCQIGISATAEDYLVRGAYLLRRMQFLSPCDSKPAPERSMCNTTLKDLPGRFMELANEAEMAFSEGQRRLPPTAPTAPAVGFDWLMEGATTSLVDLLRAGELLADSVSQGNLGCQRLRLPNAGTPAHDFFQRLDLLECKFNRSF